MKNKNNNSYKDIFNEFINILNTPEFKEVDRRLSILYKSIKDDNNKEYDSKFISEKFIFYLIDIFSFLDENNLELLRIELYKNIDMINEIIDNIKSKDKLNYLKNLIKNNKSICNIINYFKYNVNIKNLTKIFLDNLYNEVNGSPKY